MTLLLGLVVTMFAVVKFGHLVSRFNPNMSSYTEENHADLKLDLKEKAFQVAFSVEDYFKPKRLKDDPAYIKWLFRLWGKRQGQPFERHLSAHLCTEEDYANFYPIQDAYSKTLDEIKSDPERGFYCLDWSVEEQFLLFGTENDDEYQRFELVLLPCNSLYSDVGLLPGELATVDAECHESLAEQAQYIG